MRTRNCERAYPQIMLSACHSHHVFSSTASQTDKTSNSTKDHPCDGCMLIYVIHYSFIHSFRAFYSAPSSPLLLRGAPDYTARILFRSFTPKRTCRELQVKDLPKVPTCMAARAGVEPTTLRLRVIVSTNAPPNASLVSSDFRSEKHTS